ncbi:MAG: hypothetical protein ABIT09_06615 [Croceibacterium sp.]
MSDLELEKTLMPNAAFTAAACRIARLPRPKFNDVMASGDYPSAPTSQPGYPRVFELPDLIGLFLFARLNERGLTVKQAGGIACRIVGQLKDAVNNGRELPEAVYIAHGMVGNSYCGPVQRTDDDKPDVNILASHTVMPGGAEGILYSEIWNITNLRYEVEKGLAEESRIVGTDD